MEATPLTIEDVKTTVGAELLAFRTELPTLVGAAVTAAVKDLPDRTQAERVLGGGDPLRPAGSGARIIDPRSFEYERLKRVDPEMAVFRTPDADHHVGEWMRAMADPSGVDRVRAQKAIDGITKIYGRATLAEGATTAVSGLSAGTGGAFVPLPLAGTIILERNRENMLRPVFQRFESSTKTLRVPGAGKATVAMVAEGATAAAGEPATTSTLFDRNKMQGKFRASKEMLQDSAFNVATYFAERGGSALGEKEEDEFTNADGTGARFTNSLGNAAITEVTEATITVLTYADVLSLFFAVPKPYRRSGVWFGSSTMLNFLSRITVANGFGPLLIPRTAPATGIGDEPGLHGSIFGKPVMEIPLTATGTLIFGDPKFYGYLDAADLEVEVSPHVAWATDEVEWKITQRMDGNIMLVDAFRKIAGITSIAS